ncbi:MAG: ABC transporter substrate-binding protein [Spirochaetota bacterium]
MKSFQRFSALFLVFALVAAGVFAGGQGEEEAELIDDEDLTGEVEVLHWWTSGGEAEALQAIIDAVEEEGHSWEDFAVAGGGGDEAMTTLRSRAVAGNPPTAAQVKGPQIQDWAGEGFLADLTPVAEDQGWDDIIPEVVADIMKYEGNYVAVPVNVHRMNWMWVNPDLFEEADVDIPTTWDEFEEAADELEDAGILPVAWTGGDIWEASVLELIIAGVGGVDFYRDAMVRRDPNAVDSDTMIEALEILKMIESYADEGASAREWNESTAMVIEGEAAIQFMGDFAKGEFIVADQEAGEDYVAVPAPETEDQFMFNIDSFIFFDQKDEADIAAQQDLARIILEPDVQTAFNQVKGSIPVRTDIDSDPFDLPAQDSMEAFIAADENDALIPSMAHEMAVDRAVRGAILDTVTTYVNTDDMSAEEAASELAAAVAGAR